MVALVTMLRFHPIISLSAAVLNSLSRWQGRVTKRGADDLVDGGLHLGVRQTLVSSVRAIMLLTMIEKKMMIIEKT